MKTSVYLIQLYQGAKKRKTGNILILRRRSLGLMKSFAFAFKLTSSGGGFRPLWETFPDSSVTPQNVKMKFSKFNLTSLGVILHMATIFIIFIIFFIMATFGYECIAEWKSEETCIGLILLKFATGDIFGF